MVQHCLLLLLLLLVLPAEGHNVVEVLVFTDPRCSRPLGRVLLLADGQCNCVECNHPAPQERDLPPQEPPQPAPTAATPTIPPDANSSATIPFSTRSPTSTQTDAARSTRTETPSLTWAANNETDNFFFNATATVVSVTATISAALPTTPAPRSIDDSCQHCLFPSPVLVARGVATCAAYSPTPKLRLHLTNGRCIDEPLNNTYLISPQRDVCTSLGPASEHELYGYFSSATCAHDPAADDTGMTRTEVLLLALLFLLLAAAGIALATVLLLRKARRYSQIVSAASKYKKEDRTLREAATKASTAVKGQAEDAVKNKREVEKLEGDGGHSVLNPPPRHRTLRDEVDQITCQMAQVEGEIEMQRQIFRDALV